MGKHRYHHHRHNHNEVKAVGTKEQGALSGTSVEIEMHSVRGSSVGTGGYRDGTLDSESCDFDIEGHDRDDHEEFETVSDITAFTRAVDQGPGRVDPTMRAKRRNMIVPCVVFGACVLAVILVGGRSGGTNDGPSSTTTMMSFENQDDDDTAAASGTSHEQGGGRIVEFTVANLQTNINNCTHNVNDPHVLQCIPSRNGPSTDKFRIQLYPEWAPLGAKRFEYLTTSDFWRDARIFRVMPNFVSQFGLSSDPEVQAIWSSLGAIDDDPIVGVSNDRGTVSFATSGENTRTTQVFINTEDNWYLDEQGFSPIGKVLGAGAGFGGMEVVDKFYAGYGEKPDQTRIREEGAEYLQEKFPLLSYFVKAEFVDDGDLFDR